VLLGFQLGGIVGHRFLSGYRVSMDIGRSELRLEKVAGPPPVRPGAASAVPGRGGRDGRAPI
jgi:hypothetical protein